MTMEFVYESNEVPSIVGEYRGQEVALPLDFPKPLIWFCTKKIAKVTDPAGVSVQAEVLVLEDGSVFKLEDRILKETIYGSVHCGFKLEIDDETEGYCYDQTSLVACKKYSKSKIKEKMHLTQENPLKEFAAMQFLGDDHPHIMGQIKCIEDHNYYYSIMRFCTGGELFEYLDTGSMSESKARKAFLQIVDAMEFMHSKGVAHRDMSLENLLIFHPDDEERMEIIVIDWGMSVRVPMHKTEEGWKGYLVPAMGCCGKKNYIAPEVIRNADKRAATAFSPLLGDVWSLGVILFMLLTSIPPFETASNSNRAYNAIRQGKLGALLTHWGYTVSAPAQELLNRLFTTSPSDRPTFSEIKTHPWMTTTPS
jgi:serine/threonine protein kinase